MYGLDVTWLLGQNFEDFPEVDRRSGLRLDRRAGGVEDFSAEDEGISARERVVSTAPASATPSLSLPDSRMAAGVRVSELATTTRAPSLFLSRCSTLRPRSCSVRLAVRAATNGPLPMNGQPRGGVRQAQPPRAGGYVDEVHVEAGYSPAASRAARASPASLTIPISRMPASIIACSSRVMRGVLATRAGAHA